MCLEKKNITSVFSFLDNGLDEVPLEETIVMPPDMYELYRVRMTRKNSYTDMAYIALNVLVDQERDTNLLRFERQIGTEVNTLQVSKRLTIPGSEMPSANTFWHICSVEKGIFVSSYYKKSFVPVRTDFVRVEPCTVLVNNRAILTVKFFLHELGVTIYKDVLCYHRNSLSEVLCSLCKLKEFPAGMKYSYTTYVGGSWTVAYITPGMLDLTIWELLSLQEIQVSNTKDFFILSPECVCVPVDRV